MVLTASLCDAPYTKGVTVRAIFSNPAGWKFVKKIFFLPK